MQFMLSFIITKTEQARGWTFVQMYDAVWCNRRQWIIFSKVFYHWCTYCIIYRLYLPWHLLLVQLQSMGMDAHAQTFNDSNRGWGSNNRDLGFVDNKVSLYWWKYPFIFPNDFLIHQSTTRTRTYSTVSTEDIGNTLMKKMKLYRDTQYTMKGNL